MRKWLVLFVQVPFVALMWSACGGGDNNNADAAADVTTPDTAPDKKVTPDAPADTNNLCGPTAVDATSVTWTHPRAIQPYGCSAQQIQDYIAICIDGTNTTISCTAWATANATCNTCVYSQDSDSIYAATIYMTTSQYIYANVGGCIALLTGDSSDTGCGAKAWKATECEDSACSACMTDADYNTCTATSDTGTCATFVNAQCDLTDAGAASPCVVGTTPDESFTAVATVMCGGYAADAGPPVDAGGGG
jgi:hypothetical protein